MILTCPECATRYDIDPAKFPAAGRKVRCKKCAHVWFQPGEAAPQIAEDPADIFVEDAPSPARIEQPEPDSDADENPARNYRGNISADVSANESFAPPPVAAKRAARKSGGGMRAAALLLGWVALVGAVLIIGWSAMTYRQQIAGAWPKSASLFERMGMAVNARGLDFADVEHKSQSEDGQPVLVITGKLVNVSAKPMTVPPLRVTLSDAGKHPIYGWNFAATAPSLAPGQSANFRTRLSNPPSAARHVDIRFADGAE